jgi:hypothetical protein
MSVIFPDLLLKLGWVNFPPQKPIRTTLDGLGYSLSCHFVAPYSGLDRQCMTTANDGHGLAISLRDPANEIGVGNHRRLIVLANLLPFHANAS